MHKVERQEAVQEEKTGLIRYLLEYLWANNYSRMSNNLLLDNYVEFANQY